MAMMYGRWLQPATIWPRRRNDGAGWGWRDACARTAASAGSAPRPRSPSSSAAKHPTREVPRQIVRTLFVMSILVPGLFMALRDRFKALLLYLWFAFFRPQDWMWLDISALKPSLALGLVLIVPAIFSGILPDLTHPLSVGALLFLGSSLLAQFNAVNAQVGWEWIDFLTRLLLVCLLGVTLITTVRRMVAVVAGGSGAFGIHAAQAGVGSMVGGGGRVFCGLSRALLANNR